MAEVGYSNSLSISSYITFYWIGVSMSNQCKWFMFYISFTVALAFASMGYIGGSYSHIYEDANKLEK